MNFLHFMAPMMRHEFAIATVVYVFLCALSPLASRAWASDPGPLWEKRWIHGSENCESNTDPAIESYAYSQNTYVLRQNKCLSYEAPFMYLLIGDYRALLLDSGATAESTVFPLYQVVKRLIGDKPLLVLHSHGHRDHKAADGQFVDKAGVEVIGVKFDELQAFFEFDQWPDDEAILHLGDRDLHIIPTPGHQEEAITVYDSQTGWLFTGDTIYPGRVYVKNWSAYRDSVSRLAVFAENYPITALLGGHIEMNASSGEVYPIGTHYQPAEAALPLAKGVLLEMVVALDKHQQPFEIDLPELSIVPMNGLQRTVSNIARWLNR